MDEIEEFADERQKSWCIHCGGWIALRECNGDHVPTKSLLREPYPENLPVVEVCKACNEGFSLDEEYVTAFLGCVLAGSTDPDRQRNPRVERILRQSPKLKERIEGAKTVHMTLGGETRLVWKPERERVDRIIIKNARGHAFFEYGEPMLDKPASVWSAPLESLTMSEREQFENVEMGAFWPEVGSRMLTRVMTGQDLLGGWVIVQDGVYRYSVVQRDGLLVRSVLFEYLATEVHWRR
ncbi:MAG: hypothetical protein ABFD89_01990 [Bryobacteraceae bacterium]